MFDDGSDCGKGEFLWTFTARSDSKECHCLAIWSFGLLGYRRGTGVEAAGPRTGEIG